MPTPEFNLARDIWATRPKPFSTLGGGVMKGALPGAAVGAMVGGLPGAAVGAGLGITFGVLSISVKKVIDNMNQLEQTTRKLLETYKGYSPVINRLRHQWRALDVRMNRAWAQTIAPTLKKFSDIGIEFHERWNKVKIEIFESIRPFLHDLVNFLGTLSKPIVILFEVLGKTIGDLLSSFTKLLQILGILKEPKEHERVSGLKKFPMEWPAVEGPLTGAMKRLKLTGPPFTEEKRRSEEPEAEEELPQDETSRKIRERYPHGIPSTLQPFSYPDLRKKKPEQAPGVNVEVNVGDSKELSAVFEQAWRIATYELRKIEAEDTYRAFVLQQQSTYT